ncbi:MAG: squalene--hopene cyclase [Phycisphaerales bacterium]|nr:squalene--hopene cyclase [Phycisphaerales bacterium]
MSATISSAELHVRAVQPADPPASLPRRARRSLDRALDALFAKAHPDGHWCAELEGDSILNSEYLLMKWMLAQEREPDASPADAERFRKIGVYLRMLQRDDGTWGQYPGSPPDISACVKAYFALKLLGDDTEAAHMRSARRAILDLGGAEAINTFSMFYLAGLGQVTWDACPSIPPEIVLLPRWFPFHLDKVAAWTRTMILPLALCTALRPVRALPEHLGIAELFRDQSARTRLNKPWDRAETLGWTNIFLAIDRALKVLQRLGLMPLRPRALDSAERWVVERMSDRTTDGIGAIFPPMVYAQVALKARGYQRDHPVIREAERQLDRFIVEAPDHIRIQPCFSPVWDTGTALYAVTQAGLTAANDARVARVCDWLREREISLVGDWLNNLRPEDRGPWMRSGGLGTRMPEGIGAWAFEYRNDWYPDVDDTAMVAMALRRAGDRPGQSGNRAASDRSAAWILAMQNDDGGWAAFDRTEDRRWMEAVPFADHNAMQDPSCADITGRTIESLITCGVSARHAAVRRAVDYLRREQRPQGCWWGRWGVNFLYGTWQAVGGLIAAGEDPGQPYLRRALDWLRAAQNDDGGFGESANSYLDESLMARGPSTASQTAWGVISLMNLLGRDAAGDESVRRAVGYLIETQLDAPLAPEPPRTLHEEPGGSWAEPWFTGTGFPKVFYLRYHLYRHYFPVIALARFTALSAAHPRRP